MPEGTRILSPAGCQHPRGVRMIMSQEMGDVKDVGYNAVAVSSVAARTG